VDLIPDVPQAPALRRLLADQRFVFLAAGGLNTAFGFGVFTALQLTLGQSVGYLVVLGLSYLIGTVEAFFVYRRFVFKVRHNLVRDFARFQSVSVGALLINAALLPVLVELAHLPVIGSQAIVIVVNAVVSYAGHKHISFRRST
jgi:putative flippase GtrA